MSGNNKIVVWDCFYAGMQETVETGKSYMERAQLFLTEAEAKKHELATRDILYSKKMSTYCCSYEIEIADILNCLNNGDSGYTGTGNCLSVELL